MPFIQLLHSQRAETLHFNHNLAVETSYRCGFSDTLKISATGDVHEASVMVLRSLVMDGEVLECCLSCYDGSLFRPFAHIPSLSPNSYYRSRGPTLKRNSSTMNAT